MRIWERPVLAGAAQGGGQVWRGGELGSVARRQPPGTVGQSNGPGPHCGSWRSSSVFLSFLTSPSHVTVAWNQHPRASKGDGRDESLQMPPPWVCVAQGEGIHGFPGMTVYMSRDQDKRQTSMCSLWPHLSYLLEDLKKAPKINQI